MQLGGAIGLSLITKTGARVGGWGYIQFLQLNTMYMYKDGQMIECMYGTDSEKVYT